MKKRNLSITSIAIVFLATVLAVVVVFVGENNTGLDSKPSLGNSSIIDSLGTNDEDFASLTTMYRTITLVQKHYLDASRIIPKKMLLEAMEELELDIAMLIAKEKGDELIVKIGNAEKSFALNDLKTPWLLLSRFKNIFSFIKKNITDESVDFNELQYVAINGMLKALDPHTVLLTPDFYRSMKDRTHGNFGGLGIVISIRDGNLTIISPIDGTPAQQAGLKAGDIITKIDEASTINMPINDAVGLMRGKPGTSVAIHILRKNWSEEKTFKIKRAIIKVRSIDSASMPGKIGYIRIHDFQANTATDLLEHLNQLSAKGSLNGLILDLRSNPGGLLTAAINVADIFLSEGVIVTTAGQQLSERKVQYAHDFGNEPSYPIVVLVNSGTASASEIVAGALKGHERAVIVGERTFGKGSVQVLNEFEDNSALKLTTAQYLTPGDISIQSVGIVPHIELMKLRADKQAIHLKKSIRYREGDLSHHIENTGQKQTGLAAVTMKYLFTPELKNEESIVEENSDGEDEPFSEPPLDEEDDITEQTTYNFKFEPDFEINLAKDIALQMKSAHTQKFDLKTLQGVFQQKQKQERSKLIAALRKLGIDWSLKESSPSSITAQASILYADKLTAGEKNELEIQVTNTGSAPIYQLLATTRSDFAPLNQKDLAMGKIAPGQTIRRTLSFKIPKNYSTRTDDVKIEFEDAAKNKFSPIATRFSVKSLPLPVFAFSTLFMDDVSGNGDGLLQPGETIKLVTQIHNAGQGNAVSVYANLTNESGNHVFLSKGRQKLNALAPGETKQAEFEFEIKKEFAEKNVKLKLSVMDVDLRVFTTQALNYVILPPLDIKANMPATMVETTKNTPLLSAPAATPSTVALGIVPKGTAVKVLAEANNHYRISLKNTTNANKKDTDIQAVEPQKRKDTDEDKTQGRGAQTIDEKENNAPWAWISKLDTTITQATEPAPVKLTVNEPPKVEIEFDDQVVRKDHIVISGIAKDEQLVKDLYIFNNKDKVFFAPNQKKSLPFNAKIPLEYGINFITIVAEETADLETRQTLVIRRDTKDGMPYISAADIEGTPELLGIFPVTQ